MQRTLSQKVCSNCVSVLGAIAIATTGPSGIPTAQAIPLPELLFRGIQVLQFANVSDRQERKLGQQINRNLLNRGMKLYGDPGINSYVNQVGQRLVKAGAQRKIPYTFQVVQNRAVNAFATAGGYVYVTTGLLKAADNEAQLASVMAHEIGHIEERHLIKQIRQTVIAQNLAATALGSDQNLIANLGIELLLNRPKSRSDEYKADQVGLRILHQANYATSAMPAFMRKLLKEGGGAPTFLSTHPAVPDRLTALDRAIQSGPQNECDRNPNYFSCGLDAIAYRQQVRSQLTLRE